MFLRSGFFKAISFTNKKKLPISYWLLVVLRFALTILPQKGYIHPDEYFQNVEVIAGDIFPVDISRTWEFNPKFPIRNIFIPKTVFGPPLHFIRMMNPYTKHYFNVNLRTPYYLLVIPRLLICLLSLINDYCLYKICVLYGQNYRNRLKIFASSYVMLVYSTRGFSNTFEMIFFSLLLTLVSKCMLTSDKIIYHDEFLREKYKNAQTPVEKVKLFKLRTHLPAHSLSSVAFIATITVIGIFNRPTFVGFAFPPLFFWLHRGLGSKVIGFKDFHYRILSLFLCGLPTALLLILIDSVYYGYFTMVDLESFNLSWDNWVVTPLNFLRYNSNTRNLTSHGLHARWMHLAVNVPLLFNVLGGYAIIALSLNTYRFMRGHYSKLPRIQSITGLMVFSLVVPITLLSMFPHQEARFIIPTLLPLIYLYGNSLYSNETDGKQTITFKKLFLYLWYIVNGLMLIFYGFIHQAGIYAFTNNLYSEIVSQYGVHTHVITTHSYSIPTFLLQLESTNKYYQDKTTGHKYKLAPSTFLHKYGSLPVNDLFFKIDEVLSNAEMLLHEANKKYRFYVVSPCPLEKKIKEAARKYYYIDLVEETSYFPHFCTEAIPTFPHVHDQYCTKDINFRQNVSQSVDLTILERISCYINKFCLKVYSVTASHTIT